MHALLTEPALEPITLQEAKDHLLVEHDEDDLIIRELIKGAREHFELRCNRKLVRQKWRLYMDYGLGDFKFDVYPVQEVEQIQYVDTDGATQTLSSSIYTVDIPRQCVYRAYNQVYPATRNILNAAWADVWAGEYIATESPIDTTVRMPGNAKIAMLMMINDAYEHRGAQSEMALFANRTYEILIEPLINYA